MWKKKNESGSLFVVVYFFLFGIEQKVNSERFSWNLSEKSEITNDTRFEPALFYFF